ncbi:alpha/beta fold hydrolase [Arthrobacter sp. CAN_C5]|uniref:alpha/beta fold hydrolase n=1 Tax=Arthrobacter sp. CAN_C5 TaxID=2760706 RepID=UPI001AEB480C|nr:alpha/beta fold hydrolase [Arthrobacter sp. CAN_C5]MBP2216618.1 pimeloyl-ACP methyl ester carboxylesterase [Arthrobacter sp. CAN_C5]
MHFERHGSGKPLLLVHGLGSSLRTWDPIMPALTAERDVIAVDLPGFGRSSPLVGPATVGTLTDALERFIEAEGFQGIDLVGSSMGARMVLELARRGHPGTTVSLDPGGFWSDRQRLVFGVSITASVALVRAIQPALSFLTRTAAGRTALLAQFSAHPWKLHPHLVLTELRGYSASPSLDEALRSLIEGPLQQGAARGSLPGRVVIGWGRQDRVTPASQAATAQRRFPDASLHWFDASGHFPHWDQPAPAARLILDSTS